MERAGDVAWRARGGERLDPIEGIEGVAQQEPPRCVDGAALATVLEAPVRLELRLPRELEVEVRRPARRPGGASQDDAEDIGRSDLIDQPAEVEKLLRRRRGVPAAHVGGRRARVPTSRLEGLDLGVRPEEIAADRIEVVGTRLHASEERVEAGDVDARGVVARLERLNERRARAGERIEHPPACRNMPVEQRLDELRDELAEVRVEAVNVLRALSLRERRLRPRQLEIVRPVERFLGRGHDRSVRRGALRTPRSDRAPSRSVRRGRNAGQSSLVDRDDLEPDPDVGRLGLRESQTCAARRTRRRFSASTAPIAPPNPLPLAPSPRRTSAPAHAGRSDRARCGPHERSSR